jgi:hypothetical protein
VLTPDVVCRLVTESRQNILKPRTPPAFPPKGNSRARTVETFFAGRHEFQTSLGVCYILYFEQWGFVMSSDHREGGPRSSTTLGRHVPVQVSRRFRI